MSGSLDARTKDLLRVAFMIVDEGKDASFWFNKVAKHWTEFHGEVLSDDNLADVYELICDEFPRLSDHVRFRVWCKAI